MLTTSLRGVLLSIALGACGPVTSMAPAPVTSPAPAPSTPAPVAPSTPAPVAPFTSADGRVDLEPLADGVWLHRTTRVEDGVPANGLVIATADHGAVLVDTGWSDADGEALYAVVRDHLGRTITDAIATHDHVDRVGGVRALVGHGVHIHAGAATAAKMIAEGLPAPEDVAASPAVRTIGGVAIELFYPGAGHTADNIVVWLPATKILFGGCFVKSPAATDLGNLADADLTAWPASIAATRARYPHAAIIVPGHGPITGDDPAIDGLARTAALLRATAR
jgi:metallo-beta-lactamase class B